MDDRSYDGETKGWTVTCDNALNSVINKFKKLPSTVVEVEN